MKHSQPVTALNISQPITTLTTVTTPATTHNVTTSQQSQPVTTHTITIITISYNTHYHSQRAPVIALVAMHPRHYSSSHLALGLAGRFPTPGIRPNVATVGLMPPGCLISGLAKATLHGGDVPRRLLPSND